MILSEPCIQFTDAKNCRDRLHFQSIRNSDTFYIVFYAVNIAKNAESNVESIRNSDTFEAFYSLNMPKLESGCQRYRIEILILSGPFREYAFFSWGGGPEEFGGGSANFDMLQRVGLFIVLV